MVSVIKTAQAIPANSESTSLCPECDAPVLVARDPVIGRQFRCSKCGATLEIVETTPLKLDYAFVAPIEGYQNFRPE